MKNSSLKMPYLVQFRATGLRIWEKTLNSNGLIFLLLLWFGILVAVFLMNTVYMRPVEQAAYSSRRVQNIITFWTQNGFWKHLGLSFSESPAANPNALVYRSYPHVYLYPLYAISRLNYQLHGEVFSVSLYVLYNQAMIWLLSACFGFLGVLTARHVNRSPFMALVLGITGQSAYHTFPYHLERYFEVRPTQVVCLCIMGVLIAEILAQEDTRKRWLVLQGVCIWLLAYSEKGMAVAGLGAFFFLLLVTKTASLKKVTLLFCSLCLGIACHILQLMLITWKFPGISLVGATFLFRSGLDGATNHVGILTPAQMGTANAFLRNIGFLALFLLLWYFFRNKEQSLKIPILCVLTIIAFYTVPGYLFNQAFLIHTYIYDLFLGLAAIFACWFVLAPYLERITGNSGIVTWIFVIAGFCLCMYQLRVFAVRYPLPIPEPDWRSYLLFG